MSLHTKFHYNWQFPSWCVAFFLVDVFVLVLLKGVFFRIVLKEPPKLFSQYLGVFFSSMMNTDYGNGIE